MACSTVSRPRSSHTATSTSTDGRIRAPTSLPVPPGGRKLVVVKVKPRYLSSDLFTPFAEPRSTQPSIAEFVRPSYSRERLWGTDKSSYGGVGTACHQFTERGCGSISRSHRHYGSGCINYCYYEDKLGNGTGHHSEQLLGKDEPPLKRHHRWSDKEPHYENNHYVPDSSEMALAVKEVQANLYGTSSYKRDFASFVRAFQKKHLSLPALVHQQVNRDSAYLQNKSTSQEQGNVSGEVCQETSSSSGEKDGTETDAAGCDDSNDHGSEMELEASDSSSLNSAHTHGHMICTSDGTNALPDHMIITDLSELPSHFRRVTTKYNRNCCHLFPCRVPFYLWKQHHLLPSLITSLPSKGEEAKGKASNGEVCRFIALSTYHTDYPAHVKLHGNTAGCNHSNSAGTKLPQLEHMVARKQPVGGAKMVSLTPQKERVRGVKGHVKQSSHLIQNLGARFKTDAHTRYHSLFSDAVPDFQTLEPSKRHTFFGYHTSTFRG